MNFPRYSLNVFRLALLAALTLAAGCLKRNFNIQSEANAKTSNPLFSLDVNDVSFLFPLPKNVSQIDSLFPLTFSTRSGPLVEKALFQDIVQKADYKSDVTGTRLRSGVVFSGRRRELRQNFVGPRGTQSFSPGPFSFDDMAKWRIVGFRFDPCSPRIDADRMQKDLVVLPSSFEGNDFCSTQIRLIAQPLLTVGEDFMSETDVGMPGVAMQPSDADKEKMQAGDYALHLVYEVGQNKAKEIASSLLEIKSACGGLSEGLPLGVHPCLRSASIQKTRKDALMQSIGDILKNHATNLAAVAVMGTELSQEPWVFYVGAISKDKKSFLHQRIRAVTVGNPKTASATDSEGKRLPFENGFYQMLTFLMSSRSLSEAEGTSEPVVPLANTENAKDTIDDLVKPIRQRFGQRIEEDPKGVITDALRRISKIQNPHLNDVNTTDCVSCHRATAVDHLFVPRMNSSEDLVKVRDEVAAELLQSGLRYSHEKQSAFVSPSAIQTDKYSVLNFGYFRDKASVSFRTANESSYSAEFTNNLLGLQRSPTCASERLAACVDSYFTRFGTMDIVTDQNFDEALDEELNDRIIVHSCYVLTCGKSPFSPTQLDKVKVVKAGQNSQ